MAESARDEGQTPPAGWRQLTAINTAKVLTIVLLLVLAAVIGVKDMRQVVYLSLHISYCLWWLLEQWLPAAGAALQRGRHFDNLVLIRAFRAGSGPAECKSTSADQ